MATNAALTLQAPPPADSGKIVNLNPASGSGNVSWQDLQVELAMMIQTVLSCMSNMLNFISQEQQQNAEMSQLNVGLAKLQSAQADKDYKAEIASENQPWYDKLLDIVLKYILPIALAIVSLFTFGATAFLIAVVILAITLIPMNSEGQSLLQIVSGAIAEGIGSACGMTPDQIQILQGCIGLIIAIGLAVLGGVGALEGTVVEVAETAAEEASTVAGSVGETVAGTVGETVGETTETVAETAENAAAKFKMNAAKFTAFNTFASTASNSNAFYEIFYGSYMTANPTADRSKAAQYAQIFSLVMEVVTSLICMVGSGISLAKGAEDAGQFNSFAKGLGSAGSLNLMRAMNIFQTTTNVASGVADVQKGFAAYELGKLMSELTRILGSLNYTLGTNAMLNQLSSSLTAFQKQIQTEDMALLGHRQNFSGPASTEAQALMG
jgi:hypothetical protein